MYFIYIFENQNRTIESKWLPQHIYRKRNHVLSPRFIIEHKDSTHFERIKVESNSIMQKNHLYYLQ
jgi:hypothetical protein